MTSVEPHIGGSGWNLSQMVLGITFYDGFLVETFERVLGCTFLKIFYQEEKGVLLWTRQRALYGST